MPAQMALFVATCSIDHPEINAAETALDHWGHDLLCIVAEIGKVFPADRCSFVPTPSRLNSNHSNYKPFLLMGLHFEVRSMKSAQVSFIEASRVCTGDCSGWRDHGDGSPVPMMILAMD